MNATSWVRKHVDVFLCDVLVASYPIVLPEVGHPIPDQDFIDAAIEQMSTSKNCESPEVAPARFMVRAVES